MFRLLKNVLEHPQGERYLDLEVRLHRSHDQDGRRVPSLRQREEDRDRGRRLRGVRRRHARRQDLERTLAIRALPPSTIPAESSPRKHLGVPCRDR